MDHLQRNNRANQGKLPLRQYTIRGERGAVRCDTLHVFTVFQARRVVGLLHARAISPDSPPENVATYLWGSRTVKHHFCANCGCGTYSELPDWSTGKPDFDNPKVGVNSRLFDDFDLDAVPVTVIDGKNLW